jgi:2,3-bisphosphoglycerate-dependent phosphoglycerate mutase
MASRLVLLRHGESEWNLANRFTGWTDVGLTERGVTEAISAGESLLSEGFEPAIVHMSVLTRAIATAHHTLETMGRLWIPYVKTWRLNERHYGDLQGLDKAETAARYGDDQVHEWRRSFRTPPPPLPIDDPRHPSHDPRYADLSPEEVPASESLADVIERFMPYWDDRIVPDLAALEQVLVVAHGNSLRGLVKHLDGISDEDIPSLNIPTGIPLVYEFDRDLEVTRREYLAPTEVVEAAARAVADQHKSH